MCLCTWYLIPIKWGLGFLDQWLFQLSICICIFLLITGDCFILSNGVVNLQQV